MSKIEFTMDHFKAEFPAIAEALIAEGKEAGKTEGAAAGGLSGARAGSFVDEAEIERKAKTEWGTSAAIRAEFCGNESWYIAYKKAAAKGLAKHTKQNTIKGTDNV